MGQVTIQPDSTTGYDASINSNTTLSNTGKNYGGAIVINNAQTSAGGGYEAFLIKFADLSSIPAGATINQVTLSLYRSNGYGNAATYTIQRLLRNWGEGTKTGTNSAAGDCAWLYYSNPTSWTTAGAKGAGTDISTASGTCTIATGVAAGWINVTHAQMATDVTNWIGGTANYGWRIGSTTQFSSSCQHYSSDYTTDTTLIPKLIIDYTDSAPAGQFLSLGTKMW